MRNSSHSLLPYLHIPLQAGSDHILGAMRRRYKVQEFLEFLDKATSIVPDLCIGTDIMVGFPGETETDFEQTCHVFLEAPFAFCHVFTYSERDGTVAAKRDDHVPLPERKRRSAHLRRLSAMKRYDFHESFLGRELPVLFENQREATWPGYTPNYIRVVIPSAGDNLLNRRGLVRLDSISADFVDGTLIEMLD
jgi:threonylcarbamoyladenosine tRNA methylthiotransferase MtaB